MVAQLTSLSTPNPKTIPDVDIENYFKIDEELVREAFDDLKTGLSDILNEYLKLLRNTGRKFHKAIHEEDELSHIKAYKEITKDYTPFKKIAEQARILYRETSNENEGRFDIIANLVDSVADLNGFKTAEALANKAHLLSDKGITYLSSLIDGEEAIKAKDIALATKPPEWKETHRVAWVDKANPDDTDKRPLAKGYVIDTEEDCGDIILEVQPDGKEETVLVEGRKLKILPEPKTSEFVVICQRGVYCNKQGILTGQQFNEENEKLGEVTLLDNPTEKILIPWKLIEKSKLPDQVIDKLLKPMQLEGSELLSELQEKNRELQEKLEGLEDSTELIEVKRSLELELQQKEDAIAKLSENYQKAEEAVVELETENLTLKEQLANTPVAEESKTYCPEYQSVTSISDCQKGDNVVVTIGKAGYPAKIIDIRDTYLEVSALRKQDGQLASHEICIQKQQINSGEIAIARMVGQTKFDNKIKRLEAKIAELKKKENLPPVEIDLDPNAEKKIAALEYEIKQLQEQIQRKDEANQGLAETENNLFSAIKALKVVSQDLLNSSGFYKENQEVLVLEFPEQEYKGIGVIKSIKGGMAQVETVNGSIVNCILGSLLPKN